MSDSPFLEAVMSNLFACPNSECTYQFDADQLPAAAMVTCPLCHTRFPYRASQPSGQRSDHDGRDERDDGSHHDDEGGAGRRPRENRLVNPRYMPKSNKTQTILMFVGAAVVVVVTLVVIIMAGKNNPFRSNRDLSDTTTNSDLNFVFRKWDSEWKEDSGTMSRMKADGFSGFVRRKNDSEGNADARILLYAKDFGKSSPRPNELRGVMNDLLRKGFKSLDPPEYLQASIADVPAAEIRFQGESDGKQIIGEGFAFDHRGIGYIILYWSQSDTWNSLKPEIDSYVKSFQFAGTREKWGDAGAAVEKYFVDGGNYQLADFDAVWERGTELPKDDGEKKAPPPKKNSYVIPDMKDKDPNATMAFRLKKSKFRPPPQVIVIVLDQANDPLEAVRAYWLKKLEGEQLGDAKVTLEAGKAPAGTGIPKSEASVGVFEGKISTAPKDKQFYAISALNIGDKLVGAVTWCPDKEADTTGPLLLNFVASLSERK